MTEEKKNCYRTFRGTLIRDNTLVPADQLLIRETPLEIFINGVSIVRSQCLARDVEQMVAGFAFCEGFLQKPSDLKKMDVDLSSGRADLEIDLPPEKLADFARHERVAAGGGRTALLSRSGAANRTFSRISSDFTVDAARLLCIGNAFNAVEGLHQDSRFVHSAAVANIDGMIAHFEDVGRHNALDKAIGYAFLNELDFGHLILLCSGRFSMEMVTRAACLGVPVYVSPASASLDAVGFAESIDMTLCGRVKPDTAYIYSAPWRVVPGDKND